MQTTEVKIARIGNSRGVRIPAEVLRRYAFTEVAILVEGVDGLLLCPRKEKDVKMSWADTAKAMAEASESWSDWDATSSDGIAELDWESSCVAEKKIGYGKPQTPATRRRK